MNLFEMAESEERLVRYLSMLGNTRIESDDGERTIIFEARERIADGLAEFVNLRLNRSLAMMRFFV
jgi:hypothetical protein